VLSEAGVLSVNNNEYNPRSTATRAEVAAMFRNFLLYVVDVNEGEGLTRRHRQ